jgi:galactitol-specific phosphotransferase system IIB component
MAHITVWSFIKSLFTFIWIHPKEVLESAEIIVEVVEVAKEVLESADIIVEVVEVAKEVLESAEIIVEVVEVAKEVLESAEIIVEVVEVANTITTIPPDSINVSKSNQKYHYTNFLTDQ